MPVCFSGDPARAEEALAPLRALGDPVFDLVGELPYAELQSSLDDGEPAGMHYYWKTEYVGELGDELLATVRELAAECPIPEAEVGFLALGGALGDRPEDDGAVGNRDARYVLGINGMWAPGEPAAPEYRAWIRAAWARIRPYSTGGSYVNFQTADEDAARVRATYRANLHRLVAVKARYDPDNLFRCNRNLPGRVAR
jgi:FAD/FMN-containing dehydrogenase